MNVAPDTLVRLSLVSVSFNYLFGDLEIRRSVSLYLCCPMDSAPRSEQMNLEVGGWCSLTNLPPADIFVPVPYFMPIDGSVGGRD